MAVWRGSEFVWNCIKIRPMADRADGVEDWWEV